MSLDSSTPWIGLLALNIGALAFLAVAEILVFHRRRRPRPDDPVSLDPLIRLVERQEEQTAAAACRESGELLPPAAVGMRGRSR